jgi:glutaminyl-peptide cyclotransferase
MKYESFMNESPLERGTALAGSGTLAAARCVLDTLTSRGYIGSFSLENIYSNVWGLFINVPLIKSLRTERINSSFAYRLLHHFSRRMFVLIHFLLNIRLVAQHCLAALLIVLFLTGCGKKEMKQDAVIPQPVYKAPSSVPLFSGQRAYDLIVQQTDFGPRIPNSDAQVKCADFIAGFLRGKADSVFEQNFTFPGYNGEQLHLRNIFASFNKAATQRILFAAHWDSRPRADYERDEKKKALPIDGANDGASGAAVLLHLAELMAERKPSIGIDLLFLDGEDYGFERDDAMFCIGSKYFASTIEQSYKPVFGILLDLIADPAAKFYPEGFSKKYANDVNNLIWSTARSLGMKEFVDGRSFQIYDDHIPINTVTGIRMIDIIDAELVGRQSEDPERKYWHTLQDTNVHCSAATLEHLGTVLVHIIYGMQPA